MKETMLAFYYYPQWLWISTSRFVKLYLESLSVFPLSLAAIPRFLLVSILSILALLVSYILLTVVFIEKISLGIFLKPKTYKTVFIVGAPRSGTTRMHKLMAADEGQFTAMKMWELFFAPSILQKIVFKSIGQVDALFGAPFYKATTSIEKRLYKNFNTIHSLSLFNIEEDALILNHLFSSYHLSFLLGKERSYNYLNRDEKIPKAVWAYYKICLDNHMALNGGKVYLSKNPFFSGSLNSLSSLFEEVKFIHMQRDIKEMAPSFFSLKRFLSKVFYGVEPSKEKYQEINEALKFWNSAPQEHTEKNNIFTAPYTDLKSKPDTLVSSCYDFLNVRLEEKFKKQLQKEAAASKNYQSKHSYSAEEFKL
jgi:omega-hydroxy-beta-dihydromenaquinone-9 sulfotransferase